MVSELIARYVFAMALVKLVLLRALVSSADSSTNTVISPLVLLVLPPVRAYCSNIEALAMERKVIPRVLISSACTGSEKTRVSSPRFISRLNEDKVGGVLSSMKLVTTLPGNSCSMGSFPFPETSLTVTLVTVM